MSSKLTILIINWRDPKSPLHGGAEKVTRKYAEYWANNGHKVTWLTNHFRLPDGTISADCEIENGVRYIRVSKPLTGSLLSYLMVFPLFLFQIIWRARRLLTKENVDVVVDEIHGLPFYSPAYSKAKNVLLVCEVAGPIWKKMFPRPISTLGGLLERLTYAAYRHSEIWAISESTKADIEQITGRADIRVLPMGIDECGVRSSIPKFSRPTGVFVARLVPMKGIESAIYATKEVIAEYPLFRLLVLGGGREEYLRQLRVLVNRLGIDHAVEFVGFVDEDRKLDLIAQSHFLLNPSFKEGFGLTVLEAGLIGTPCVAREGFGLSILVRHGVNGFLFKCDKEMAEAMRRALRENIAELFAQDARRMANEYLWNKVLPRSCAITGIAKA